MVAFRSGHRPVRASAGHLALRLEDGLAGALSFLPERADRRLPGAFGFSVAAHAAAFVLIALGLAPRLPQTTAAVVPPPARPGIVWLSANGPGGGGGGGGNRMPAPIRKAELPGADAMTLPVAPPPMVPVVAVVDADGPKADQLSVLARMLAGGQEVVPGSIDGLVSSGTSRGPGSDGGAGIGRGPGDGPGRGSGLGPGWDGGYGGEAYAPGNGVSEPTLLKDVRPIYTLAAMTQKIQGRVLLECIVLPDGSVGPVRVVHSLDPVFGLDREAVHAAKQWRFLPGRRAGLPVAVAITIEMTFNLR